MQTKESIEAILSEVSFLNWRFNVGNNSGGMYLQVAFYAPDNDTKTIQYIPQAGLLIRWSGPREFKLQKGRKWYISPWMTKSEVVQTAFKAALTALEHEARELFKYKGAAIFGPHFCVEKLASLASDDKNKDVREDDV